VFSISGNQVKIAYAEHSEQCRRKCLRFEDT
jgi:hypothetical protein